MCASGISAATVRSDAGPVAWWHLDENGGLAVHDSSGNGHGGTVYGAKWGDGISQSALVFDGADNYVEVPTSPDLNLTSAITIEVWIKQYSLDDMDRTIIAKGPSSTDVSNYDLRIHEGKVRFLFKDPGVSWVVYSTDEPVVTADTWMHIAVVHVWGNASATKIYVDGVEKPGMWIAGNGDEETVSNPYPLYISGTGRLNGFNGAIDEVRIYNRPLSGEEIKAHYDEMISGGSAGGTTTDTGASFPSGWVIVAAAPAIIAVLLIAFVFWRKRTHGER